MLISDTLGPQEQRLTKMGISLTEDFTPSVAMRKGKAMHMGETGENQTQMLGDFVVCSEVYSTSIDPFTFVDLLERKENMRR